MVSGRSLSICKISHIITTKVLKEVNCNFKFAVSLLKTFRACFLYTFNEEIPDLFVLHCFNQLSVDLSKH